MSFSEKVKSELLKIKPKPDEVYALRFGELVTEAKDITINEINEVTKKDSQKKAFLKGAFLGSGCISEPSKDYHFELLVTSKKYSNVIVNFLNHFKFNPKITKRKEDYVIYLKESEQISNVLALMGAFNSVLEFENVRVEKSISGAVNRTVNCETANLNKVITASVKQVAAINKLIKKNKFFSLNDKLKQAANLRLKYEDKSLEELVALAPFKVSKSGLYHRLNKIVSISEEI